MATLRVLGVRHHSPACARRVQEIVREARPAYVLVEGPADMNPRLGELGLPHRLPVAVYSYRLDAGDETRARGTWTPFCDYSPEWVALREAAAIGAEARFIDLPAWDDAFRDILNRYGEGARVTGAHVRELAQRHGFDCSDALWDHLFEAALDADGRAGGALERKLETYFDALRGDDPPSEMDRRREAYMASWIAWAMSRTEGTVLVVTGGYHAPALKRLVAALPSPDAPPDVPPPDDARVGSFLVPFSFRRLDSFAGYASGMPSPAYYQAVWERGDGAPEAMMRAAVTRIRAIGQVVSTADLAAATTLTAGLARIRGHRTPTRVDTLDGLVSALLEEPIDAPLPWSERGVLAPGTSPLLVELVRAYSGTRSGVLADATPRPPLVDDARAALEAVGQTLAAAPRRAELSLASDADQPARQVLHRLRILAIAGVQLESAGSLARGKTKSAEVWHLVEHEETLPTLIERSVYGASLAQAARARLMERLSEAEDLSAFILVMRDAFAAGFERLAEELTASAFAAVEHEGQLPVAGRALEDLVGMDRRLRLRTGAPSETHALLRAVFDSDALALGERRRGSRPSLRRG